LILLIFFGVIAIKIEFGPYEIAIFSGLSYFAHFLFLIVAILSFLLEWRNYQKQKTLKEFPLTLVAIIISSLIFFRIAQRDIIEAKPTVIKVESLQNVFYKTTFEFKEGNDFKLLVHNGGVLDIYHGKYQKIQDTIKIKSSNYDEPEKQLPAFGVIKNDTMFWNKFDTMVVDKNK